MSATSQHSCVPRGQRQCHYYDAKVVQCAVACRQVGHKVCFWSETHKIGFGVQDQWPAAARLEGWKLVWSGLKQEAQAGVGLLLAEEVELVGAPEEVVPRRILFARVKSRGTQLATWSVYAPTNAQADTTKHEFFRALGRSLDEMKKRYPIYARLCVGDFNATLRTDALHSHFSEHFKAKPTLSIWMPFHSWKTLSKPGNLA